MKEHFGGILPNQAGSSVLKNQLILYIFNCKIAMFLLPATLNAIVYTVGPYKTILTKSPPPSLNFVF